MKTLRQFWIASLIALVLASSATQAASTTNYTDQWWTPGINGAGAAVLQQGEVLFVDVFAYDSDRSPTWFTAAAYRKADSPAGHDVFSGDLYLTNGTYYGAGAYADPTYAKVGTLTFDATASDRATLTYSVSGTVIAREVTRLLWRYENLSGSYFSFWAYGCSGGGIRNEYVDTMQVQHDPGSNAITIRSEDWPPPALGYFLFEGTYSQSGHVGKIVAELQPTDHGTVTFSEIETSASGFGGRISGTINNCQVTNGRIAAVRR